MIKNKLFALLWTMVLFSFITSLPISAKNKADSTTVKSDSLKFQKEYKKIVETKETKTQHGLFSIYKTKKNYYFGIPSKRLSESMLVVNKLTRVPSELNEAGVNAGINYQNLMIRFELDSINNKIKIRQIHPTPVTPSQDAIAQSVHDNYISPLIEALDIVAISPDASEYLVKVNDLYNGENSSLNSVFKHINLGTSPIGKLSQINSMRSFPNNVVTNSTLTTKVTEGQESIHITVEVNSTILLLPEEPLVGRLDSRKVGYFTANFLDFTDAQQRVHKVKYINRWRMEPREEDQAAYLRGELVEPKKPIIIYISNSTPYRWRPYIKSGIEAWNSAFEGAGFKNAIRCEYMTDSLQVEADDINYSVLTYNASEKSNAMGASIVDPRSGEILEADIIWWHNVIKMVKEWVNVQLGGYMPEARGINIPDSLMGDAIRFVACHEMGHSLGLRHNMMGSSRYPVENYRSKQFTDSIKSTATSIMDYARFNYIAQPGDGVTQNTPHIGAYDRFAIEYGYRWYAASTPQAELPEINKLLARYDAPLYYYSEAQSVRDAVDPRAQNEDLGDDPVLASQYGIKNLQRIVPNIIKWTTTGESEQSYADASRLYYAVVNQWNNYLYHVLAEVGGIYLDVTTVGDGRQTYTYVPKEKQKEALQFLLDNVFTSQDWLFQNDISTYTYLQKQSPIGIIENAPTKVQKAAQLYLLWDLMLNTRLMRMLENETVNGDKAFTAVDMMDMMHKHIFATTIRKRNPDVLTRSLQKGFVDALITSASESQGIKVNKHLYTDNWFLAPQQMPCEMGYDHSLTSKNTQTDRQGSKRTIDLYGTQTMRVSDAISVKRGEMLRILKMLNHRNPKDIATKYHYNDLKMRIKSALGMNLN